MESEDRSQRIGRRSFLRGAAASAVGLGLGSAVAPGAIAEDSPESRTVKRRVLGKTKVPVSVITFGGGGLRPDTSNMLKVAYDNGINSFDVAWTYGGGKAELGVGEFFKTFKERDKIFLSTKASGFKSPPGTKKACLAAFEAKVKESLDRMNTDYVDLLMWPHNATDTAFLKDDNMRDALLALKKKGMVKHIGFSSHENYAKVCDAAIDDGFYEAILLVANICTQNTADAGETRRSVEDTRKMLLNAKKKDVGILAMKVANNGFLGTGTDKLLTSWKAPSASLSRHQKLYAYALGMPEIATVVVGIKNATHLREAVAVGKI